MATESTILKKIQLAVSSIGARVFRNNQGMAQYGAVMVRYGLCNPGGSDLIGWYSVTVTPDMIGKKIAVFLALEAKKEKGTITPPQQKFIDVVNEAGGIAGVARNETEALDIIKKRCDYRN